jgi:hypothetical protein
MSAEQSWSVSQVFIAVWQVLLVAQSPHVPQSFELSQVPPELDDEDDAVVPDDEDVEADDDEEEDEPVAPDEEDVDDDELDEDAVEGPMVSSTSK